MVEMRDAEAIRRCLEGDPNAFSELVDRYQKIIFNLALRMTKNVDDAEDLTQNLFIKVYENLAEYNPRHRFFSWIYRIAMNECLNHLKTRRYGEPIDSKILSPAPTPEEVYETSQSEEIVSRCLMRMHEEYRILIILKHLHEFSYREMAYILDLPEKKVKSRLYAARMMFKEILIKSGNASHGQSKDAAYTQGD